jgi:hypothetical protein
MPEPRDTDVHTCHSECPCRTGGEPMRDFLPVEGSLLPGLFMLARLRQRQRDVCEVCGAGPTGRCDPPDDYEGDCPHGCSPER